ncbi:hypothetical protein [Streptomyces sp. NPDC091219]
MIARKGAWFTGLTFSRGQRGVPLLPDTHATFEYQSPTNSPPALMS